MPVDIPPEVIEQAAKAARVALDERIHDSLCACSGGAGNCSTYGSRIPWSYDAEEFADEGSRVIAQYAYQRALEDARALIWLSQGTDLDGFAGGRAAALAALDRLAEENN